MGRSTQMLRFDILSGCFSILISLSFQISAEDINSYDELVVTAFRTPTQLDAIGSAYTIITAEEIKNRQAQTVSDLLRTVPGIEIDRSGPVGTATTLRMRGGESNHTLVIIDGAVANDQSQDGTFNFADLMTTDIERIEVIRGPQSALWGSDALSGVINIITKKGSGKTKIIANLEAGSFDSKKIGGSISGGSQLYDYKLSASKFNTEGTNIRQGLTTSNDKLVNDRDGYDNNRLSFSGGYRPNDDLELTTSVTHTTSTNEFDGGGFASNDQESSNHYTYGSMQITHNSFDYHWQNSAKTTFRLTDHDTFVSGTQSSGSSAEEYELALQSSVFFDTPELLNANHAFTLAYEHETTDIKSINLTGFNSPDSAEKNNTVNSYIAEYRISFLDRLHLSASGRHDDQTLFDDFTTYRTTAAFVIPETGSRLHASYGTGVKNPGISEIDTVFGTFVGNPNLVPEQSRSWDAGIEQSFFNERLVFDATYFQERLEDEIIVVFGTPNTNKNAAGISRRRGYELSLSARVSDKTDLTGSYTYTDSVQDQNGTGTFTREVRRPPHITSLNLNHRFYNDRVNFNIGVFHNGDDLDTSSRLIKQYTLVNLAASFDATKYVNLYAKIDNLTNQVYQSPIGFFSSGIAAYAGINLSLNP